jgi:hypothetical protein
MTMNSWTTAIALAGLLAGCGSSGGTPGDGGSGGRGGSAGHGGASGGGGTGVASGEIVWLEDGTSESVPTALADRAQQGIYDSLEIAGSELVLTDARSIGIIVTSPSALGGTYLCSDTTDVVEISYLDGSANEYQAQSCTVTLTVPALVPDGGTSDAGAGRAVGTFTIVLTAAGGITKNLTDGSFDIPITNGN